MKVGTASLHGADRVHYVLAEVTSDSVAFPTTPMFFGLSSADSPALEETAAPFVPGLLVLAAKLGEDLHFDGALPEGLVEGATSAAELLHRWWGWRAPRVTCAGTAEPRERADGVGLFFSRGIDSWSVLLSQLAAPETAPTHLLALDAEPVLPTETVEALLDGVDRIGRELGIPTLRIVTNVRDVLDRFTDWGRETHGAVLAGAALLLRPVIGRAVISASQWVGDGERLGSHPDLDILWSTASVAIEHADAGRRRWQRVETVATSDLALSTLQVCYRTSEPTNCGHCEKCLRTMTSLEVAGALHRTHRFQEPLSVAAVRRVGAMKTFPQADLLQHLDGCWPALEELRQAWEEVPAAADDGAPAATSAKLTRRPVLVDGHHSSGAALHLSPIVVGMTGERLDHLGTRRGEALVVGWRDGELGLLPPRALARDVVDRLIEGSERSETWCVSHGATSDRLYAAELATRALGSGLVATGAEGENVDELRPAARASLWWLDRAGLDPVALLDSLLAGCVPLQVMPDAAAHRLRPTLPGPLGGLVWERSRLDHAADALDPLVDALAAWLTHENQESLLTRYQERTLRLGAPRR